MTFDWSSLGESLRTAWLEIASHKMRSFLSFFAIAIGVGAILYTSAQVTGMNESLKKALELMGPGRLEIEMKRNYTGKGLSPGLTSDDADAIRGSMPELYMVYPEATAWGTDFRYKDFFNENFQAKGITPEWRRRDWVYTLRGRFINEEDVRQGNRVAVIQQPGGWDVKPFWAKWMDEQPIEGLLGRRELLGETIWLNDRLFTVVGVIKEPPRDKDPRWFNRSWGGNGTVFVPISTYQRALARPGRGDPRSVEGIQIDTGAEDSIPVYKRKIEQLLLARHRELDFEVKDNREQIQGILNSLRERAVAILAVGIVAILAGGIGIMNVTLATIFSRIKEIGVRRAVGATRSDIMLQFLIEAMFLGFLGGVAGIGLGLLMVNTLTPAGGRFEASLSAHHFGLALLISVGTGFLFALYPASQAARLDPVEALHYE